MLKLNASYSKKVPAEADYSSKSYHAAVEVELPDGLTHEQLQGRIRETFELVRNSVEAELHGNGASQNQQPAPDVKGTTQAPARPQNGNGQQNGNSHRWEPASDRQVKYLLKLAAGQRLSVAELCKMANVGSLDRLSRRECSNLIDDFTHRQAA